MPILETLQRINSHYGRGDVVATESHNKGTGVAVIHYGWVGKGQTKSVERRRFTIVGNKVRFRGITRVVR